MIRFFQHKDLKQIVKIFDNIALPKNIFIKSSEEEIKNFINCQSLVCEEDGKILGFIFLQKNYIDTIVSLQKGIGTKLLNSLSSGVYQTNISFKNIPSQCLFNKFNKKFLNREIVCGQIRGRYEITI